MTKGQLLTSLGAVCAMAVGIAYFYKTQPMDRIPRAFSATDGGDQPGRVGQADSDEPRSGKPSEVVSMPANVPSAYTLPPADVEKAGIPELLAAAREGDTRAACQAARRLSDCVALREIPEEQLALAVASMEANADAASDHSAANQWGGMQLAMIDAAKACVGVEADTLALAGDIARTAAVAGNRAAMLKYSSGEFLGLSPGISATQDPRFEQWRLEALRFAMEAVRQGSVEAAFVLWQAYSSDEGALPGLVRDDVVQAHIYKFLLHLAQGEAVETNAQLTPAQWSEAMAQAKKLHQDVFGGSTPRRESSVLGPTWLNPASESDVNPCLATGSPPQDSANY